MEGNVGGMVSLYGTNWMTWKTKMEDLLYCKDLYELFKGIKAKPEGTSDADWNKLDRKAVRIIWQWIDDNVFHHISTKNSVNALWKKLENLYDRKTTANKAFLFWKLVNLKSKAGSSIAEHLNELNSITNQFASMKLIFDDEL